MSLILGKNTSNELQPCQMDSFNNIKVDLAGSSGGAISADVTIVADSVGLSTSALQTSGNASLTTIASDTTSVDSKITFCNTNATVISSSALPAGAATDAVLQSADSYLGTIATDTFNLDTKTTQGYDAQIASGGNGLIQNLVYGRDNSGNLDALKTTSNGNLEVEVSGPLGSDLSANSVSVVIASDQSAIPVSTAGANTTNVNETLAGSSNGTVNSTAVDMNGSTNLTIFGTASNTLDPIVVQVSHDNSTWLESGDYFVNISASGGSYSVRISNEGARYWRVSQTDTSASAFTLVVNSSKK